VKSSRIASLIGSLLFLIVTFEIGNQARAYNYDARGNRTGQGPTVTHQVNGLDQIRQRTITNREYGLLGTVNPQAQLKLFHPLASPTGEVMYVNPETGDFGGWWTVPSNYLNGQGGRIDLTVRGTIAGAGVDGTDAVAETDLHLPLAPALEALAYDGAGRLKEDAFWTYNWDGAGRLTTMYRKGNMMPEPGMSSDSVSFSYDADNRRTYKNRSIFYLDGRLRTITSQVLWSGSLPIMEDYSDSEGASGRRWYHWGPDLSGTRDGAGGIGGLVAIIDERDETPVRTLLPVQDGLGNITAVIDQADGRVVARFDYGPFGEPLGEWGEVDVCPFRWQTYWYDSESQHYYKRHRYYDPRLGRWLSRDPIGEEGGFNLYAYCGNDPVNRHDPLGLSDLWTERQRAQRAWVHAMDYGTPEELAAAEAAMTILPGDPRLSPIPTSQQVLMNIAGGLIGPSKADEALSPAQPLGSGFGHQASLYGWSFYNSYAQFVSLGSDPSRLFTGEQSFSANAIGEQYMRNFTYVERSAADFNSFVASMVAPSAAGKVGEFAQGSFCALRNFNARLDWSPVFAPYRSSYANTGIPLPGLPRFRMMRFLDWSPGHPITKLTTEGAYPSWSTIRSRYWQNRILADPGGFGPANRAIMQKGFAPKARVIVRDRATGRVYERLVEKELHHAGGNRGIPGFDEPIDLREVWPWEHELLFPIGRQLDYDFLRFL
jgi:RHS repeat-associated protein